MYDWVDESIFLFLKSMIPAAYLISNKTVLSLHNFRFPSIFLSWQLAIAIVGLFAFYRKCFNIRTLGELRYFVAVGIVQTAALYFGSRTLAVLPVPVFIAGQITGLYFVNVVNHIRLYQTSIKWIAFQTFNSVLILPLFVVICMGYAWGVVVQLILHVTSNAVLAAVADYNRGGYDVATEVKAYIVTYGISVICLVVYGTFSREIMTAAAFDYSRTHFKVYLFTSGMLCATASITRLAASPSDLAHQYVEVFQYLFALLLGYVYDYNGHGMPEYCVCLYFVFLLWTNKHSQNYPSLSNGKSDKSAMVEL